MSNKLTNQITGASVFNSLYLGTTQKPEMYGFALGPVALALGPVALAPVALAPVALAPVALAPVAPAPAPASALFAKLTTEDALT